MNPIVIKTDADAEVAQTDADVAQTDADVAQTDADVTHNWCRCYPKLIQMLLKEKSRLHSVSLGHPVTSETSHRIVCNMQH